VTRSATGGYNIGLDKSSGTAANFVFAPGVFTASDIVFLVGSYAFNTGSTSDDVSQLWVNPSPSTFGQAVAPPGALTSTAGGDISGITSFVLFNRNANEPAGIVADEVRVGASWASVTPPAEVASVPILNLSQAGAASVLSWTTDAPGFVLESSSTVAPSNVWSRVIAPVFINGGQFVVTNNPGGGTVFYRLRLPEN
jgi:hypothetical protein